MTVNISPHAVIGNGCTIGEGTIIKDNVILGNRVKVGEYCILGEETPLSGGRPLVVGDDSLIRSFSIFYEGSTFGAKLTTGHRVTVRENLRAGLNLQIGTLSDLQGDAAIGDYVRLHSNVHIGKGAELADFVWIFPYVVLTNDPHPPSNVHMGVKIGRFTAIATMSTILPGVEIGEDCLVGAGSIVNRAVSSGMVAAGNPAKTLFPASRIKLKNNPEVSAYPWRTHFHRGYPEEVVQRWLAEIET